MLDDPYKILGVSRNATKEEIKKAYHKKVKENHPDLHPDDPSANKRMSEINTAYDMLMHPYKYEGQWANGSANSRNTNNQRTSGNSKSSNRTSYSERDETYEEYYEEIPEILCAIQFIEEKDYRSALIFLSRVPAEQRGAKWYYLSGLANHGMGNTPRDIEMMRMAVVLDPQNKQYKNMLNQYQSQGVDWQYTAQNSNPQIFNLNFIFRYFLTLMKTMLIAGIALGILIMLLRFLAY